MCSVYGLYIYIYSSSIFSSHGGRYMYIVQCMCVPRIVFPFLYYTISITKYSYYITITSTININTYPTTANNRYYNYHYYRWTAVAVLVDANITQRTAWTTETLCYSRTSLSPDDTSRWGLTLSDVYYSWSLCCCFYMYIYHWFLNAIYTYYICIHYTHFIYACYRYNHTIHALYTHHTVLYCADYCHNGHGHCW